MYTQKWFSSTSHTNEFKIVTSYSKAHPGVWDWNSQLAISSDNNSNNNNNYVSLNSMAKNFRFEHVARGQT